MTKLNEGRLCNACAVAIEPDDVFCATCGAFQIYVCPVCELEYSIDDRFCMTDGAALTLKGIAAGATSSSSSWQNDVAGGIHLAQSALGPFWQRHSALIVITVVLSIGAVVASDAASPLVSVILMVAIIAGWSVALTRSEKSLVIVDRIDDWTDKIEYSSSRGGKIRRYMVFPIAWFTNMLAIQTKRIPDMWSAAGVRLICYILATTLVLLLLFWATVIIITLVMIGIGLWILAAVMGDGPDFGGADKKIVKAAGNRARKVIRERDGLLFKGDILAHIDENGRIRSRDGIIFSGDEIANIDENGQIRGKDGIIFRGSEIANVDANGRVRGKDGIIFKGEEIANIGKDGRIRSRDGIIFEGDQIGRIEDE